MTNQDTLKRAKWPKHLIIPSEEQFKHGDWIRSDKDMSAAYKLDDPDTREDLRYDCGTACCLVGWACLAFDEECAEPMDIQNPATAKFLAKFIELSGNKAPVKKPGESNLSYFNLLALEASDVFEGDGDYEERLQPRRARELWKKTAESFGYDTKNLVA